MIFAPKGYLDDGGGWTATLKAAGAQFDRNRADNGSSSLGIEDAWVRERALQECTLARGASEGH